MATADGRRHTARVVVSNASPFATFGQMIEDQSLVADYQARYREYSVSLSSFQVFLGLDVDLARKLGITDAEVFCEPSYDCEPSYARAAVADVENGGVYVTLYENISPGYSPPGRAPSTS